MTIATRTEGDQKVIERVESELLSGRSFALIEQSHRSVPLGGPPATSRGYGEVIKALGRFAAQGDWFAAAAWPAIVKVNPYATPNEVVAQVAGTLAKFVRSGYFDVIGATGPEASRPSAHQHVITLRQAILLKMLMVEVEEAIGFCGSVPGLGWCMQALMEREEMTLPTYLFPLHAAAQVRRAAQR